MTDRILLRGVRARGTHGVLEFEKRDGQEFVVDVVLEADLSAAGRTDDLARTINYAEVAAAVVARIEGPSLDLIETLAAQIAEDALTHPRVESVEVTVHKPQAPVGVPFGDVAVVVQRRRPEVPIVVALGSNLGSEVDGERLSAADTVRRAAAEVGAQLGGSLRLSDLVLTAPVGGPEQPDYVNAVALLRTRCSPYEVLRRLHAIEQRFGRTREVRWGARTLDLDLIQYGDPSAAGDTPSGDAAGVSDTPSGDAGVGRAATGDVVLMDPELTLPHPRAHERAFVLVPWAQLDPSAVLRLGGQRPAVAALLAGLDRSGVRPAPGTEVRTA